MGVIEQFSSSVPFRSPRRADFEMKAFVSLIFLFVAAKGAAIGGGDHEEYVNENLVGKWREDQYKRTGLNNFLYEMGLGWFKGTVATTASWENEQYITFDDAESKFHVEGIKGPQATQLVPFDLITDKSTRTEVELGQLGGSTSAEAYIEGYSLVTNIYNKETGEHFLTATRTLHPDEPNHMTYTTLHIPSDTSLVSEYYRMPEEAEE